MFKVEARSKKWKRRAAVDQAGARMEKNKKFLKINEVSKEKAQQGLMWEQPIAVVFITKMS